MRAEGITLRELFQHERRHVVPLYQRPYVWEKEGRWKPLWEDVLRIAERDLAGKDTRPHFMGAVVLDQMRTSAREVAACLVIDGQQRLTTLQLLLAAVRDLCQERGDTETRKKFDRLTYNEDASGPEDDQCFKVWPTNADRGQFRILMDRSPELSPLEKIKRARATTPRGHLLAEAYAYFRDEASEWLDEGGAGELARRLDSLLKVLRDRFHLVVISLEETDEAQVIFETLNSRGTPLLSADLVKNFLLRFEGLDDPMRERLYETWWKPFDERGGFWRTKVKQGRLLRPQLEVFLQHYLSCVQREEVTANELFPVFKHFAEKHSEMQAEDHLRSLGEHARIFRGFHEAPEGSRRSVFFRRLAEMETTTVVPFLLGLVERYPWEDYGPELDLVLQDLESFLVRRMVCRLTAKNYNQLFLEMLVALEEGEEHPAEATRSFLLKQTAESRRWPDDDELRKSWTTLPAFKVLKRSRLRMVLEALESALWDDRSEKIIVRERLTIEHLMPQSWEEHWPLPDRALEDAGTRRETAIHRIGNLTLVTGRLNPALSNQAWSSKKKQILEHAVLKLSRQLQNIEHWDEDAIDRRTSELFDVALRVWPRPTG